MSGKGSSVAEYTDIYGRLVFPALLALITFAFFAMSLRYEMYLNMDDSFYVIFNKHLDLSWSNIAYWFKNSCLGLYTPLPMVSYMFDHALWGGNVAGYHLQNIFWHVLMVIVIYNIFIELEIDRRVAFFLVLIFAVHPQRIESVVWIAERKDVMSGFFYFACLLAWLKSYKQGGWFSPLSWILMILGCLSKPMAVTIPAVIFCILWHREHKVALKSFAIRLAPYLTISCMYVVLKFIYLSQVIKDISAPEKDWLRTVFMVLDNFRMYFVKTFLPNDLIPLYPYFELSTSVIFMIVMFYLSAIAIVIVLLCKTKKSLIYNIIPMLACFIAVLLPVVGIFNFSNADFADRYSYIPSVFLWCGVGIVMSSILKSREMDKQTIFLKNSRYYGITVAFAACYMLYIIGYAILYMPCWKDNYTLYLTICDHENPNFRGLAVLSNLEYSKGNYAGAIAYAESIQPKPWMPDVQKRAIGLYKDYVKGMVCYNTGMREEAMTCFVRILSAPEMPLLKIMIRESCREIIGNAGNYYIQHGKLKQASVVFARMPAIYPEEVVDCYFYRGLAAFLNGNLEAARTEFAAAQKIAPADEKIVANLKRVEELLRQKAK